MSHYIRDIALYGVALFVLGAGWEIVEALIQKFRAPTLPFSRRKAC